VLTQSRRRRTPARPRGQAPAPGVKPPARCQAVKEYVRDRIRRGTWRPGARVASENDLVAALRVSRMTVNRALRELAAGGEVVRFVGIGTFVAGEKPQSALLRVASVADEIRARRHDYAWAGGTPVTWVRCIHPGPCYRLGARFKAHQVHTCA